MDFKIFWGGRVSSLSRVALHSWELLIRFYDFKGGDLEIIDTSFLQVCPVKLFLKALYSVCPGYSEPLNDGARTLVGQASRPLLVALNNTTFISCMLFQTFGNVILE